MQWCESNTCALSRVSNQWSVYSEALQVSITRYAGDVQRCESNTCTLIVYHMMINKFWHPTSVNHNMYRRYAVIIQEHHVRQTLCVLRITILPVLTVYITPCMYDSSNIDHLHHSDSLYMADAVRIKDNYSAPLDNPFLHPTFMIIIMFIIHTIRIAYIWQMLCVLRILILPVSTKYSYTSDLLFM